MRKVRNLALINIEAGNAPKKRELSQGKLKLNKGISL